MFPEDHRQPPVHGEETAPTPGCPTRRSGRFRVTSLPRGEASTRRSGRFRVASLPRGEASGHVVVRLRRLLQDLQHQDAPLPGLLAPQGVSLREVLVANNTSRPLITAPLILLAPPHIRPPDPGPPEASAILEDATLSVLPNQ